MRGRISQREKGGTPFDRGAESISIVSTWKCQFFGIPESECATRFAKPDDEALSTQRREDAKPRREEGPDRAAEKRGHVVGLCVSAHMFCIVPEELRNWELPSWALAISALCVALCVRASVSKKSQSASNFLEGSRRTPVRAIRGIAQATLRAGFASPGVGNRSVRGAPTASSASTGAGSRITRPP